MANQIFMRVNEVAEELGISIPFAYRIIRQMNEELAKPAASPLPGELTESFSTRNSMVQDLRQKGRRNNYGSVQK